MVYRVIQWATGHAGYYGLRGIIGHPELELAGLIVHSEAKAGLDAGELCGLGPTGVLATTDIDAALRIDADCVSYMATADTRILEAVDDLERILGSSKNVVSTSVVPLVYPPHVDKTITERLDAACQKGGVSCFTNGIDPGFANDFLPLALTSVCERIDRVRVQEILNYATYDQAEVLFETMGFGKPLDETPLLLMPGILTLAWGGCVEVIAAGLGAELDEIREVYERAPAETSFDISTGHVAAGTAAGLRFELQGIVDGRPAIVVEHVTRLHDDVAPEWPHGAGYRIQIDGEPRVRAEFDVEGSDGDENSGGLIVTAMRVLNAIPAVVEAEPGLLSVLDLPPVWGRGLLR